MREHQQLNRRFGVLDTYHGETKEEQHAREIESEIRLKTDIEGIEVLIFCRWVDSIRKLNVSQVCSYRHDLSRNHNSGR